MKRVTLPATIASVLGFAVATSLVTAPAAAQEPAQPAPAAEAQPAAPAPTGPSAAELAARLDDVDQRARVAERKLELLEEAAAAAKLATPVVAASDRGFNFSSADKAFVVKVRGLIHLDGRQFLDDEAAQQSNVFLIRRARPLLEATFFDIADFRLMPDFGGGTAVVQDAYIDLRPFPWLKLRAGKFKPPVGLERLQSASAIIFAERGFPTSLVPNRDIGVQLHGVVGPQIFTYELGIWNGVVDGGSTDTDNNYAKDLVGRLFFTPFKSDPYALLSSLGFGVAGSIGGQRPTTGGTPAAVTASQLPTFRSPGQRNLFGYATGTDAPTARGRRTRLSPQLYYYYDEFGLLAEYVQSAQSVQKGLTGPSDTLTHKAWQVQLTWVFGGKAAYEGTVVTQPFSVKNGTPGAFEISARYNAIKIDQDTFGPLAFASLNSQSDEATALGGALTWHWSKNIKLLVNYEYTTFSRGAANGEDRKSEHALFERIQAAF